MNKLRIYIYIPKPEEHLHSIDPISHMSGSRLGSCETLMAGTTTLNRNSRDHQAVTMDLDELIRAPCPYYFKKYQHAMIEYGLL